MQRSAVSETTSISASPRKTVRPQPVQVSLGNTTHHRIIAIMLTTLQYRQQLLPTGKSMRELCLLPLARRMHGPDSMDRVDPSS